MDAVNNFGDGMKSKKLTLLANLVVFILLLAGCSPSTSDLSVLPTKTKTLMQPTSTIGPTIMITSGSTLILLPTGTPTPAPTLPMEQAKERFIERLSKENGCKLPCFFGITPGESVYQEAQVILSPFSNISTLTGFLPKGGVISPSYAEDDLEIFTTISFSVKTINNSSIVNSIYFEAHGSNADGYSVYDSSLFRERLNRYMLPAVLSEQGIPAAVMVSTDAGIERGKHVPGFYIVLFYPNQGIMAIYSTSRQLAGGNVRGCLSSAHVKMYLSPNGQPDAFKEMIDETDGWKNLWTEPPDSPWWKSLETATGMTLQEFYEKFRQPDENCLETPLTLWPTPEP